MAEQSSVSIFVKLHFWEAYWSAVFITARMIRKVLYIYGVALLIFAAALLYGWTHPAPELDWFVMLQNSTPLQWVLVLPLLFVFVLPLLSAQKLTTNERFKSGATYIISPAGINIETSVAKASLQWRAILQVVETKSSFLLFSAANIAHTLPKRCLATSDDIRALRELLRTNVANPKFAKD
jgi:hypothetical protein